MSSVIVAGSINIDLVASAPHHPRPGETVGGSDLRRFPGGKGANQAVAAARAGAHVMLLGAVGNDPFADEVVPFLHDAGVDVGGVVRRSDVPTGTALIVVNREGENTIVVVAGANATLDEPVVRRAGVRAGDVLVAQFETPRRTTEAFFRHGRDIGTTCVLNPAPAMRTPPDLLELVDVLLVNETELAVLTGERIVGDAPRESIVAAMGELRGRGLTGTAVTTLGARGAIALQEDDRVLHLDGHQVPVTDTTAAGDCFVGSVAACLAEGAPMDAALAYANAAAALCVTRAGAGPSIPSRAEVEELLHRGHPAP